MKKNSIVTRTFLFATLLVVIIILIAFSVLYFTMPSFYISQKRSAMEKNSQSLITQLQSANSQQSTKLIADFSIKNNSTILSFDENSLLLLDYSTPFLDITGIDAENTTNSVTVRFEPVEDAQAVTATIEKRPYTSKVVVVNDGKSTAPASTEASVIDDTSFAIGKNSEYGSATPIGDQADYMFTNEPFLSTQNPSIFTTRTVNSNFIETIEIVSTLQPISEAKQVLSSLFIIILPICLLIGAALSYFYAKQISNPIIKLSDTAAKMKTLKKNVTSDIKLNNELGQLSDNLNEMYTNLCDNLEKLEEEKQRAYELEKSKTRFMQSASHELKTPVTAILGMLEGMIDNIGVYSDKDTYLLQCKLQAEKLSAIIKEILLASKSDTISNIEASPVSIHTLVEEIIDNSSTTINQKELNIITNLEEATISSDNSLLYPAISNIINNALKYTKHGGTVWVKLKNKELLVENQFDKISQDELTKFTEPFYTGSYSRDKNKFGTGLGLYITKTNLDNLGYNFTLKTSKNGIEATVDFNDNAKMNYPAARLRGISTTPYTY